MLSLIAILCAAESASFVVLADCGNQCNTSGCFYRGRCMLTHQFLLLLGSGYTRQSKQKQHIYALPFFLCSFFK